MAQYKYGQYLNQNVGFTYDRLRTCSTAHPTHSTKPIASRIHRSGVMRSRLIR